MTPEFAKLIRLGLAVGTGLGIVLGAWSLARGLSIALAAALTLGGTGMGLLLASIAAIGVRLQRKDIPRPDDRPDDDRPRARRD